MDQQHYDEAQLAAIVQSTDDAIISYGLDGTIMTWNPAAERLYGFTAAEMIGENLQLLDPAGYPGDIKQMLARMQTGSRAWRFETTRYRKDGTPVFVAVTVSSIRDREGTLIGVSGISRDISDRVKLDAARRRAEQQLRAITDAVIDAIVASDATGNIVSWSRGAERMFGYTASDVIGKPLEIIMPERYRERHRTAMARVTKGAPPRLIGHIIPLHGLRKDGSEFPVDLSLGMWRDETGVYYSGVMRDRSKE